MVAVFYFCLKWFKLKLILCIFISFFIISCSKNKNKDKNFQRNDSVTYYLNLSNTKSLTSNRKFKYLSKAFIVLKNSSENSKIVRNQIADITFEFYRLKKLDEFYDGSSILLSKSIQGRDSLNLGKAYRCKATYFKDVKRLDSSLIYFLKAEKVYNTLNEPLVLGNILFNKGIVQFDGGDFLGAELSLTSAYEIFKDSDKKDKLYGVLNQLGLTFNELNEYDKAIFYQKKALELVQKYNLVTSFNEDIVSYNNLGYLYNKIGKYEDAIYYLELGLKNKNIINTDPDLYSLLIDNLAYSRLKSSSFKGLPGLFFDSLKIRLKLKNSTGIVTSYINLSQYYKLKRDYLKSFYYSEKAIEEARKSKIPINLIQALKQASVVNEKLAYKYSKEFIKISDSLQLVERNSRDRFTKIQLETNEILQQKDSLEKKNRNILNYFIGTIAVGGLLFFMRAQRAKSRELLLRQAQQRANEDIYRLIISQQNKLEEGRVLEKNRIAKELHDGVLGRLFGLRLNLDGLNHRNDEDAIHERIRCLEELKNIEQDLREISHELSREKYVLVNNFVAIVNNLLDEQAKINPAKLNAVIGENIDWDQLNNTTKINLYRILQESLQNINKYANAKTIKVEFRKDKKGNLVLNITDDGDGFEVDKKSKGIGLKNIVTRTHESNGIIEIKSAPGKGTRISITVPLEHKSIKN